MPGRGDILKFFLQMPRRGKVSNLNVPGAQKITKEELKTERTLLKRQKEFDKDTRFIETGNPFVPGTPEHRLYRSLSNPKGEEEVGMGEFLKRQKVKEDKRIEDLSKLLTRQKEARRRREEMRDVTSGVTGAAVKARKGAERAAGKKTNAEKFLEAMKKQRGDEERGKITEALVTQRMDQISIGRAQGAIKRIKAGSAIEDNINSFRIEYNDASKAGKKKMREMVEREGLGGLRRNGRGLIPKE